jgi:hypothetical protein
LSIEVILGFSCLLEVFLQRAGYVLVVLVCESLLLALNQLQPIAQEVVSRQDLELAFSHDQALLGHPCLHSLVVMFTPSEVVHHFLQLILRIIRLVEIAVNVPELYTLQFGRIIIRLDQIAMKLYVPKDRFLQEGELSRSTPRPFAGRSFPEDLLDLLAQVENATGGGQANHRYRQRLHIDRAL